MITDGWADSLRCSTCGAAFTLEADAVRCDACETRFPVKNHIPLLTTPDTVGTALDAAEYDAVHGVSEKVVAQAGIRWAELIKDLGYVPEHALEIGAGSGVLTLSLLRHKAVRSMTVTDVSEQFLRPLMERLSSDPTPVSLVVCDANEPHFAPETFDLVVGRSVLHHLLAYDRTLRESFAALAPGGAAIFLEPVLEGKAIVALLLALVAECDERADPPRLTDHERQRIRKEIEHMTWASDRDRGTDEIARGEDKHVFRIDELRRAGTEAGFADVTFVNNGAVWPGYWASVVMSPNLGIAADRLEPYRWIAQQFAQTYGTMFADRLVTPMGYFVFRKAARSTRNGA
jgi:2-polyprenyl-3-methyl-5-hydroxy-6-metoxy-1,4-benzoquinol methylase/DNA-directed RNA polymerase subunit RPC12/RpoP